MHAYHIDILYMIQHIWNEDLRIILELKDVRRMILEGTGLLSLPSLKNT